VAILVSKNPNKVYQSFGSPVTTQKDRNKAEKLDRIVERSIKKLISTLKKKHILPKKLGEGNSITYWEVGNALRDITSNRDLFNEVELPLLWQNVKMYISKELLYKERGPYREHLFYCYRLAGYPRELADKMSWGEWVTIFDSTGINQELRFDEWFKIKLSQQSTRLSRKWIRTFAPCVNVMLGNIHTPDLSNNELFNCYEAAWQIVREVEAKVVGQEANIDRSYLQAKIKTNIASLGRVMEGSLAATDFARIIIVNSIQ